MLNSVELHEGTVIKDFVSTAMNKTYRKIRYRGQLDNTASFFRNML